LHYAAREHHLPIVQFLLEHGADSHAKNSEGKSAADVAHDEGYADIVQVLHVHGNKHHNHQHHGHSK